MSWPVFAPPKHLAEMQQDMPESHKQLGEVFQKLESPLQRSPRRRIHGGRRHSVTCCKPGTANEPVWLPSTSRSDMVDEGSGGRRHRLRAHSRRTIWSNFSRPIFNAEAESKAAKAISAQDFLPVRALLPEKFTSTHRRCRQRLREGRKRHSGPGRNLTGRPARNDCSQRHPHLTRRLLIPRCSCSAANGKSLHLRSNRRPNRLWSKNRHGRRRHPQGRRRHLHQRNERQRLRRQHRNGAFRNHSSFGRQIPRSRKSQQLYAQMGAPHEAWCDRTRKLGVRTNSDDPEQVRRAIGFGAEGIGLTRTEHMFFEGDRIDAVREMILADSAGRPPEPHWPNFCPIQREDFTGIFEALEGRPARFVCSTRPCTNSSRTPTSKNPTSAEKSASAWKKSFERVADALHEFNPMLGHRGCRSWYRLS